ncbi:hypothetical protein THAOC_26036 [Thalassiosira oceanica]|uniref:Uncharacterized protein n=1 Tax=Thalassiosira oceanica TaxID=159749 RepID=K0RMI8_THAOC|nr:hypothetical protein THAOC_26036 [Thalassiosira oceanica]|eukprot:EJK54345.1 hypothetical protein THAOC_26036 [Thalassiosira oceanica]
MDGHQNGGPGLRPGRDPPGNYHPLTLTSRRRYPPTAIQNRQRGHARLTSDDAPQNQKSLQTGAKPTVGRPTDGFELGPGRDPPGNYHPLTCPVSDFVSESEPILTGPGIQCLVSHFFRLGQKPNVRPNKWKGPQHKARQKARGPTGPGKANTARPCAGPAGSPSSPSVPPKGFRPVTRRVKHVS